MMMDFFHPGISRGMLLQMMASRNTVPPKMLRIVPLGDFHIFFSLNSISTSTLHMYICINTSVLIDIKINAPCMNNQQATDISLKNRSRNSKITQITHCAEHVSANTTPHQLHWGDREMGTTILWSDGLPYSRVSMTHQPILLAFAFYTHRHTCTHTCTFHPLFIRSNGSTLDTYMVSPDSLSTLYCH